MLDKIEEIVRDYSPYLNDLWKVFYRTAVVFTIVFCLGFFYAGDIIKFLIFFFHLTNVSIVVISPFQFLGLATDMGFLLASLLTTPFLIWQIYAFLRPAMSKKEFSALLTYVPGAVILYILGFFYGAFTLYWALEMIAQLNNSFGLQNMWDASMFLSEVTMTASLLGVLFEFPLIISLLVRTGILDVGLLIKHRRVAYLVIVIIVALLPPTDGISLIVMSVPMVLLYEISIFWNKIFK